MLPKSLQQKIRRKKDFQWSFFEECFGEGFVTKHFFVIKVSGKMQYFIFRSVFGEGMQFLLTLKTVLETDLSQKGKEPSTDTILIE